MNLYTYVEAENKFYVFYPHFTKSVEVSEDAENKCVIFEDEFDLNEFMGYLEDNGLDSSELNPTSFGDFEIRALPLKELV